MNGPGVCYGGGIAHTLSVGCARDEHDGAEKALVKYRCEMLCAWKGGGPCLADDCPRRSPNSGGTDHG